MKVGDDVTTKIFSPLLTAPRVPQGPRLQLKTMRLGLKPKKGRCNLKTLGRF